MPSGLATNTSISRVALTQNSRPVFCLICFVPSGVSQNAPGFLRQVEAVLRQGRRNKWPRRYALIPNPRPRLAAAGADCKAAARHKVTASARAARARFAEKDERLGAASRESRAGRLILVAMISYFSHSLKHCLMLIGAVTIGAAPPPWSRSQWGDRQRLPPSAVVAALEPRLPQVEPSLSI
jgi:hypothetical protein